MRRKRERGSHPELDEAAAAEIHGSSAVHLSTTAIVVVHSECAGIRQTEERGTNRSCPAEVSSRLEAAKKCRRDVGRLIDGDGVKGLSVNSPRQKLKGQPVTVIQLAEPPSATLG
jgi:hypothetical protein